MEEGEEFIFVSQGVEPELMGKSYGVMDVSSVKERTFYSQVG